MADTVKVPLLGTHKKGTVIGVAIGGVVVSIYLIRRNQKQAAQQQAATDQAQSASAAAGYGYGQGNLPQGYYGYGEPGGGYGYGASGGFVPGGYYGYGTPFPGGGGGGGGGNVPVTTNAQWTQAAVTQLQQDGYQPQTVLAALGKYISGVAVDANETTIIQAAIGVEGYPPQAGKNNNPPGIVHGGGGGGSGQGKDADFVQAAGRGNLADIAAQHDVSKGTIDRLNPALFTRYGNTRVLPAGTKVRVH